MEPAAGRSFLRMIRRSGQGRLKIYLGYAAGVGKTCRMLEEGRRLKAEGIDVVIGVVETHGRAGTAALADGLERVALSRQEYRGISFEELDLEGVLSRRPRVVLVDELAHDNPPGGAHAKRYQDVQAILAAGIHVLSTVNVQHLESLYDTVERATGVKVRNRLPDLVLSEADEIVNVDLATEDLIQRVREGRVVGPDRVENALQNFYRPEGLEQLREMALRELASLLDFKRRFTDEDSPAPGDRIMAGLGPRREDHAALLRAASRFSGRLNRNWYAVHVQDPAAGKGADSPLPAETERLANQLGALVFTLRGADIAGTLREFAAAYRVSHAVVGKPRPRPLFSLPKGPKVFKNLLATPGLSVIGVDLDGPERPPRREPRPGPDAAPAEGARRPHRLCDALAPERILVFTEAAPYPLVLKSLAKAALAGSGLSPSLALKAIVEREAEGSTILNQGLALPHAPLRGLPEVRAALGLPRAGTLPAGPRPAPSLVFLVLYPPEAVDLHLELLSLMSRAFQDAGLRSALDGVPDGELAHASLRRWERDAEGG